MSGTFSQGNQPCTRVEQRKERIVCVCLGGGGTGVLEGSRRKLLWPLLL